MGVLHRWFVAACSVAVWLVSAGAAALPDGLVVSHGDVRLEQGALEARGDGVVLEREGGVVLRLAPGAVVRSFGLTDLWLDQGGKRSVYLLQLESGHAEISVDARAEGALPVVVRTAHKLVAALLDGSLGADVKTTSGMLLLSGNARIGTKTGWEALEPGRVVVRASGERRHRSRAVAVAPTFGALRRVWSGIRGPVHVGGFEWSATARASGYELLVSDAHQREVVHRVNSVEARLDWRALELPAGNYQLQVRAFDEFGFPGQWSQPESVVVIGFIPDEDAYRDESGVIRVGSQRTARFSHTEGLQVTYGSAGPWVSAPPVLFFRQTSRTVVRFRHPDADGIVAVPVEHQQVQANILLSPRRAVWPGAAVEVTVELSDAVGGQAASRLSPRIDVTLGLEPLELAWKREGNVLRAAIPAQTGPGPWVVRVNVAHPSGKQLDRDLLEVVAAPGAEPRSPLAERVVRHSPIARN